MEEYARFVLDDAALTEAIKTERHRLSSAVGDCTGQQDQPPNAQSPNRPIAKTPQSTPLSHGRGSETDPPESPLGKGGGDSLVAYRDIVGDVGREATTPSEFQRADAGEVVAAATKRMSEALRAIEEYGKTINPDFAAGIERLRYRGYELERRLFATVRARQRFGAVRLYVIITESLCHGDWYETAEAALHCGVDCLQLREKELPDRQLLDRAKRLAALCRDRGAIFIVNDRPDIALAAGAHGVHLGQADLPVSAARRMLPARYIIGVSTHTIEQADAAIADAPDYIAVGPMFDSPTKPQKLIAGPELLATVRARTSLPLVAIGGIDPANVRSVLDAAPCGICVCRAVISQADVTGAIAGLRAVIGKACAQGSPVSFRE
ncbi:MAG: thiamine phosphate synthase [Vicinamibacterales bacterium]|nr:thiamine phosphate synthase [Vicinamibacterales bacterium]